MFQSGFLGTDAGFVSDLTLLAEIIFFMAISLGVVAQRRGRYRLHDWIQTPVVILNLFLILFVMVTSFVEQRVVNTLPQRPDDAYYVVVAVHAALGLMAEGSAIYCLLAGYKILPRRIGRLRYWMWATFGLWTAALIAGLSTYYVWYVQAPPEVASPPVVVGTETDAAAAPESPQAQVFLQNFAFAPGELTVTAGTQVVWLNQDGAPHNVTFVDGSTASDNFFQGQSFATTFSEPGVYRIYCTLHGSPDGSGMATTVTVLQDNEENAAVVAAAPTANPVPPTPTAAPTVPPPPITLLQEDAPQRTVVGLVSFFDSTAPGDSVAVLLEGLTTPAAGALWAAWLIDSRAGTSFPIGEVRPDDGGRISLQFTDPEGRNLLELYDGFQITEEPQFDDDPTPGTVLYGGQQAPEALSLIRAIAGASENAPNPYGLGARRHTEEMLRHVAHVTTAYEFLSIADAQRHAEHIVNLLEGEEGEAYGDLDGAHGVQNPGDGYGIIPYVTQFRATALAAGDAPDATEAMRTHAEHVRLASDNALLWADQVRTAALEITAATRVGDIGSQVEALNHFGPLLLQGEDNNGDGHITPAEGGIFTAYQHAQYMAAIPVAER